MVAHTWSFRPTDGRGRVADLVTLTVDFPTSGSPIGPGTFVGVNFSPNIAAGQFLRLQVVSDAAPNPVMMNDLWTCSSSLSFSSTAVLGWQGNLNSSVYSGPTVFATQGAIHEGQACHLDVSVLDVSFSTIDSGGVLGLVFTPTLFVHQDLGALGRFLKGAIAGAHSVDDVWNSVNRTFVPS